MEKKYTITTVYYDSNLGCQRQVRPTEHGPNSVTYHECGKPVMPNRWNRKLCAECASDLYIEIVNDCVAWLEVGEGRAGERRGDFRDDRAAAVAFDLGYEYDRGLVRVERSTRTGFMGAIAMGMCD